MRWIIAIVLIGVASFYVYKCKYATVPVTTPKTENKDKMATSKETPAVEGKAVNVAQNTISRKPTPEEVARLDKQKKIDKAKATMIKDQKRKAEKDKQKEIRKKQESDKRKVAKAKKNDEYKSKIKTLQEQLTQLEAQKKDLSLQLKQAKKLRNVCKQTAYELKIKAKAKKNKLKCWHYVKGGVNKTKTLHTGKPPKHDNVKFVYKPNQSLINQAKQAEDKYQSEKNNYIRLKKQYDDIGFNINRVLANITQCKRKISR